MKNKISTALLVLCSLYCAGQRAQPDRPKLVVGIVVDQMRWDYLYRYYDRYGNGGFKRLLQHGYSCENTTINYIPSYTAPGHACIYTGSVPAIHGIAANDWFESSSGLHVYCVGDNEARPVDGSKKAGAMSPRNLKTTTITDELKLATNNRSRVFSIALKDRSSILPAGHMADGCFWFDDSTGNFITSSYYNNRLPGWLKRFNAQRRPEAMLQDDWNLLYAPQIYVSSTADNNNYEGKLWKEEPDPTFPHSVSKAPRKNYGLIRSLPAGNTLTFEAARNMIENEELGWGNSTDFVAISLSSTDYAGHTFGPNSIEVEDMFLRLDIELEYFLAFLDKTVGKNNYTLFLTADHGGAHNAAFLKDRNVSAGNLDETSLTDELKRYLRNIYPTDSVICEITNYQVVLNERYIKNSKTDRAQVKRHIIDFCNRKSEIAYVLDMENTASATIPAMIAQMAVNGYNKDRSGCIALIYQPGYYSHGGKGTTHGTWNPYDTHIPLLWYGRGIRRGTGYKEVHMEDIAPTIAALLHIQVPNGCIGKVIEDVLR